MHLILTHEGADFDALASLLGAALIETEALAVLPHRLNRNVRAFVTLYGEELHFHEAQDLPRGTVESVTLVDTQSLNKLKGMDKNMHVYVIDHHELRSDTPKSWQVTCDSVGANTTLLVEMIRDQDQLVNANQATLLLLGIYEDTGRLTYTRTTARDAQAVAWLLTQGADLAVAQEFLNHPLSTRQQALLEDLQASAETYTVQGATVIVCAGDARDYDEELSSVVQRLRDVLDPDAILAIIATGGGVQLIARATNDQVAVDDLMAEFGGGGHLRAAAAMVADGEVAEVKALLIEKLKKHVRPAQTVVDLMSHDPQTLTPKDTIQEANGLMQRYGYEGYPVMEKGKVVGLLTRRAVDRALGHHLKASVGDVMEAGSVTITPDQPVDQVRRLMTSSGWGQIPVVDAGGKLVGIVTRTDVIRVPGGESASLTQNLTTRMEAALPPARLALLKAVAEEAARQHMALYIVGGFVRDLLLDRPGVDVDLVVEGDAIALGKALKKTYGGKIITHERFGTAKWLVGEMAERLAAKLSKAFDLEISETDLPESLDLVSARREFYSEPSALPTVERGSIKLDLHRRDFPINTLALRLDGRYYGELHDHWGGLNDLEDGRIRVLHSLSFVDDPTRILRAVRYEQRYGFEIEARTLELLVNALPLLERVSGDRVRHEISAMLLEEKGTAMLSRLDELGILNAIHPELPWDKTARERLAAALKTDEGELWELEANLEGMPAQVALAYLTWLLALPSVGGASIAGRLRLPGWLTKAILAAARMYPERDGLKKKQASEVTAVLDEMPLLAVYGLWLVVPNGKIRDRLHQYATEWRYVHPKTDGHALRELGVPQGPRYKQMLDRLRAAWLDGEVKDAAGEQQLLESLLEHSR